MLIVVILLALIVAVALVGAGVAVRSRGRGEELLPPEEGERAGGAVAVEAPPEAEAAVEVEAPEAIEAPPVPEVEVPPRRRFFERLGKARAAFTGALSGLLSRERVTDDSWDELEEALIGADVGVTTTTAVVEDLRRRAKEGKVDTAAQLTEVLKQTLKDRLDRGDRALRTAPADPAMPAVVLVVGVNGTGKTTTIGKMAAAERRNGQKVVVAAADTFRAAAAEQLGTWADRAGAELVRGQEGSDPAAVVFDAIEAARARARDLCIVDTAGRLHTKSNLMEELKKIGRVIDRSAGELTETLLVLDATTGQNGIIQAREFTGAVTLSGVVLTKLDGSAKGGVVLAIEQELGIPVKLVGLGEGIDDLAPFEPDAFVEALFA